MQTETVIIMIVGLIAIGLIRLVIAMVGREFAADHPHQKASSTPSEGATESSSPAVPAQRPVRGKGKKSHLYEFPTAGVNESAAAETTDVTAHPAAS